MLKKTWTRKTGVGDEQQKKKYEAFLDIQQAVLNDDDRRRICCQAISRVRVRRTTCVLYFFLFLFFRGIFFTCRYSFPPLARSLVECLLSCLFGRYIYTPNVRFDLSTMNRLGGYRFRISGDAVPDVYGWGWSDVWYLYQCVDQPYFLGQSVVVFFFSCGFYRVWWHHNANRLRSMIRSNDSNAAAPRKVISLNCTFVPHTPHIYIRKPRRPDWADASLVERRLPKNFMAPHVN